MNIIIYDNELKKIESAIKKVKGKVDAKLFYHSCGAVRDLIDDLVDVGVEVLNPIQVSAKNMDTKYLKQKFADINPDDSVLMSREDGVRRVAGMGSLRLRCIFFLMSVSRAMGAGASVTTGKPWTSGTRAETLRMCWI